MKRPAQQQRLPKSFYDRSTTIVARELLGKALIRRIAGERVAHGRRRSVWVGGLIVETEAYLPQNDPACHADRGQTSSNRSMFGQPGTLYVYPIHAKYCLNAVTESAGKGSAVLIRALEPVWGMDWMKASRGYDDLRRLTRGPAMLCQALQIDRRHDGISLVDSPEVMIADTAGVPRFEVVTTPRIGISKATDARLRFVIAGNRYASGKVTSVATTR